MCVKTRLYGNFNNPLISYCLGQEFRALFLSTIEPLGPDGNTLNPTKSPCDPFVFNTLLTRAESLVVVVGNPNTLLCTEDHMVKKYGLSARCWSNFIHQCLSKNSFCVPMSVEKSVEKQNLFKKSLASKVAQLLKSPNSRISATSLKAVAPGLKPVCTVSRPIANTNHFKQPPNAPRSSQISSKPKTTPQHVTTSSNSQSSMPASSAHLISPRPTIAKVSSSKPSSSFVSGKCTTHLPKKAQLSIRDPRVDNGGAHQSTPSKGQYRISDILYKVYVIYVYI